MTDIFTGPATEWLASLTGKIPKPDTECVDCKEPSNGWLRCISCQMKKEEE